MTLKLKAMLKFFKRKNETNPSLKQLISSVQEVAKEQGGDYFHVEVGFGSHGSMQSGTHQSPETFRGIFFKGYTEKSGWCVAVSIPELCDILRNPRPKGVNSLIEDVKIDTDAEEK